MELIQKVRECGQVCEKLALVPGKLDHATVVAYNVGPYDPGCPPSPQPLVLPFDSKTHFDLGHNTRTSAGGKNCSLYFVL